MGTSNSKCGVEQCVMQDTKLRLSIWSTPVLTNTAALQASVRDKKVEATEDSLENDVANCKLKENVSTLALIWNVTLKKVTEP